MMAMGEGAFGCTVIEYRKYATLWLSFVIGSRFVISFQNIISF